MKRKNSLGEPETNREKTGKGKENGILTYPVASSPRAPANGPRDFHISKEKKAEQTQQKETPETAH